MEIQIKVTKPIASVTHYPQTHQTLMFISVEMISVVRVGARAIKDTHFIGMACLLTVRLVQELWLSIHLHVLCAHSCGIVTSWKLKVCKRAIGGKWSSTFCLPPLLPIFRSGSPRPKSILQFDARLAQYTALVGSVFCSSVGPPPPPPALDWLCRDFG